MRSNLARIGLALLVLGGLAGVGWIVSRQLATGGDVPDEATQAEAVLAAPGRIAHGFVNVESLAGLLGDSAKGEVDLEALLLPRLGLSGVSLADVTYAAFGVAPGAKVELVLFGRFDRDATETKLRARPGVSVRAAPNGDDLVLEVAGVHPETCADETLGIALRADRIVVADAAALPGLLARLASGAGTESTGGWLRGLRGLGSFEGERLLSVTLADPARIGEVSEAPAARAVSGALARVLAGTTQARLEVRTRSIAGGLGVALEVAGPDAAGMARRWEALRGAASSEWARVAPELAAWQDALSIDASAGAVHASGERGADSARELLSLPDALLVLASRDFRGPTVVAPPAEAPAEVEAEAEAEPVPVETDPRPVRIAAEQPLSRLRLYSPDVPLAGAADVIAGPFGVRVERATRSADADAPLELAIRAVGPLLANLPEPHAAPRLVIDSVVGASGEPLLRQERCGPDRNGTPAHLTTGLLSDFLEGTKTIRLAPDATLDSVVRIAGRVEFELPTRTQTVRAPAAIGAVIEGEGVAVELTGVAPDLLSYRVKGDPARLVLVRGVDADRRAIAVRESFEVDPLLGRGRIGSRHYSGALANVEVVVALETEQAVYPFGLTSGRPGSDGEEQHVESSSFIKYTPEQFEAEFGRTTGTWPPNRLTVAAATAGPFSVGLDGLDREAGVAARLTVIAPNVPNLSYHATALELELTRVGLEDGQTLEAAAAADAREATRALLNARRQFGRTDVEARTRLATGVADPAAPVARLDGQLVLRLPRDVDAFDWKVVEPGAEVSSGDARIVLQELGRDRLVLRMTGSIERFFSVRAFAADGHELAVEETAVPSPASPGPYELRFAVQGRPARLSAQLVRSHAERRYGFRIALPVAVPASPER